MNFLPLTNAYDETICGGKAVHLGEALRAGLPVPMGFVLSVAEVLALLKEKKDNALAVIEPILDELGGKVAARSSAVGEDSNTVSFAGQYATFLNIRSAAELLEAIAQIQASATNQNVMAYRQDFSVQGQPQMAVVVQKLIEADKAGVLFTKNPVTKADEYLIEAAFGLGRIVVDALVIPDQYRMSKSGDLIGQSIGNKDRMLISSATSGLTEIILKSEQAHESCLNIEQLKQVYQLAQRCETAFGSALDIEWAIEQQSLYLLQKRAITKG